MNVVSARSRLVVRAPASQLSALGLCASWAAGNDSKRTGTERR